MKIKHFLSSFEELLTLYQTTHFLFFFFFLYSWEKYDNTRNTYKLLSTLWYITRVSHFCGPKADGFISQHRRDESLLLLSHVGKPKVAKHTRVGEQHCYCCKLSSGPLRQEGHALRGGIVIVWLSGHVVKWYIIWSLDATWYMVHGEKIRWKGGVLVGACSQQKLAVPWLFPSGTAQQTHHMLLMWLPMSLSSITCSMHMPLNLHCGEEPCSCMTMYVTKAHLPELSASMFNVSTASINVFLFPTTVEDKNISTICM